MSSYFYIHTEKNNSNAILIESLQAYAEKNKNLIYILNKPLTDQKYNYNYNESIILLSPNHKICIINFGNDTQEFEYYVEDIIEDIGSISDKYQYKEIIGRPRHWRNNLILDEIDLSSLNNIDSFFQSIKLDDPTDIKSIDLLISLFIGSINDIDRVKKEVPLTSLDKVKQKIQLFDGDQTRFIYENLNKNKVVIQGLSGTGKTELLLHKLKDLYVNDSTSKIYFTCHNRILADSLRKRIPDFFNFMRVEQQIEWEKRLWCTNAWGSASNINSGTYRYICAFYQIPFFTYSKYQMSFSKACKLALDEIKELDKENKIKHAFTYIFIDESQDFDENFFELCSFVTEKIVFIAGDIFQSIFDDSFEKLIEPDFLLGKCYRTDPKTLMFAHALGMGLFENEKLRWLDKKEWEDCGYNIDIKNNEYYLSREPLRRFEDLDDEFESIKIIETPTIDSYDETIIELIKEIKSQNQTILPEDIGIIFIDNDNEFYRLSDILEYKIHEQIGWSVNKAYETKEKVKDHIFISNKNNVKGLEFPFVICITRSIKNSSSYRNTLYTMLTRSFIKSFLVLPKNDSSGLTIEMKNGLKKIINENIMVISEPSEDEKKEIHTRFKYNFKQKSLYDRMNDVFIDLKIDKKYHEKLISLTQQIDTSDIDYDKLVSFVKYNFQFIKE